MAKCLQPIERTDARALVLGSVPGEASISAGQYYAHARNLFWPLMEHLLGDGSALEYSARLDLFLGARIALWDVLASADRVGSLDSSIMPDSEIPNDIAGFLDAHPSVSHVYFNGAKAEASFKRHHDDLLADRGIISVRLPSTSPAHAAMSFADKLTAWRMVVECANRSMPRIREIPR